MYSFEGQYRRVPKQNLAGASTQQRKDELLHKVHAERMQREENRKKLQCAICIQACIRSFLVRQKVKEKQRQEYDNIANKIQSARDTTNNSNNLISILLSKIIFFYHPSKDLNRLKLLSQKILSKPDIIAEMSCNNINYERVKLKKFLSFHVQLLVPGKDNLATQLRIIEVFTSETIYNKFLSSDAVTQFLIDIFSYLLKKGYYSHFRLLVNKCIPPMFAPKFEPPTPFASSILDFLQRPLELVSKSTDTSFNVFVVESLLENFLISEFSDPVRYFAIPCLSMCTYFPYSELINAVLNKLSSHQDYQYSSWLLHSVIVLENENYLENCDETQFIKYLQLLSVLCQNFSKLGTYEMYTNRLQYDSDSDSEDEFYQESMISQMEIEILEEAASILNNYSKVQSIIAKANKYQNTSNENEIVECLAKISYHLLSAKKAAMHEYKILSSLALTSSFLRKLWFIITTKEQHVIFGNAATYVNIISRGVDLTPSDVQIIIPLFTTFCSLLTLLISTLHDHEFYNEEQSSGKNHPMPFTMQEMSTISCVLKDVCIGLIELAYPDCRLELKMSHHNKPRFSSNDLILNTWMRFFKVIVSLLRQLHSRDLRKQFCPEGMWVSTRITMMKFDKPNFSRRTYLRPFRGILSYTREDLEEGPPLTTRELRTLTVIKEVPFLLPFQERVVVFQSHVLKDKLEHQGEAPYAFRGRTIDVSVRRNYLYEDAFEKLSSANESDLRYAMRVQLRNAAGLDEAGVDGGGLFREFLSELLKTAFDPNRGFFRLTIDNQLYPNPHVALLHPEFVKHYYFIGKMLGKAMYENLLVELPLAEFFLSKLVSRHSDVGIHHLDSLDVVMYKNLLFLKNYEGDVSDLGLDFTVVTDELGETKIQELKPNGANIPVTNENKIEYIHLVADYKLNKQIGAQTTAFKNGLANVIQPQWLHMFSNKELQILISGAEIPVDISDLKRNTKYAGGYHEDHPTIKLFWQVVEDFDDNQRRLLLKFVTSCSRQPLFGFKELDPPFCIQKAGDADRLPTSSTCMNLLKMPEFKDYNLLKDRVLYAVQAGAGFELS